MGRTDQHQKNERNKYFIVIGLLVVIIVFLSGIVVATTYMEKDTDQVDETEITTVETEVSTAIASSTISTTSSAKALSITPVSTTVSSTSTSTIETTSSSNEEPSISVSELTTQQRAALIILGAPSDWKFNGRPSDETLYSSSKIIAESDTNDIYLQNVSVNLGENTSSNDQMFHAVGKEVGGIGGAGIPIYAFGREGNKIYYYVVKPNILEDGEYKSDTISLGVSNIDTIWKSYVDNKDIATVDRIAQHITLR